MRILASLILLSLVLGFAVSARAETKEVQNQNAGQKSKNISDESKNKIGEIKHQEVARSEKIASINESFIMAVYLPHTSSDKIKIGKYQPKNFSPLPSGSFVVNASAYTAAADECGKSDGITASGKMVQANRTLACPKSYKFGTKIEIDGMGTYVCEDRGGAIKGNHFDIYMRTKKEAFAFGRRNLIASVVE
jgi:3D (Asp-Asp-Asp) domain-containing protein